MGSVIESHYGSQQDLQRLISVVPSQMPSKSPEKVKHSNHWNKKSTSSFAKKKPVDFDGELKIRDVRYDNII